MGKVCPGCSHGWGERERGRRRLSTAGTATAKTRIPRGSKTRGTEWWEPPPDTPLNLGIPYVVSIVDDGLSLPQSRVLACITDVKAGATRWDREVDDQGRETKPRGYFCDPGGYSRIAKNTGLCRKTVYNAMIALIAKGVLRVWNVQMKGRQRVKTLYFALHYGDILPHWRSNADFPDLRAGRNVDGTWKRTMKLFHTAHNNSIVVRKRSKQFVGAEEGAEWGMDAARAPRRGSGRGLTEVREQSPVPKGVIALPAPAPIDSDEDVYFVYQELIRQTSSLACLDDAVAIIAEARDEAKRLGYSDMGYGGPFPALTVAELISHAGGAYKPKRTRIADGYYSVEHERPTPGWFLGGQIRREVGRHLKHEWEQKQG